MDTVLSILHVVTSVFIVGPMAILPMTAMRALRAGQAGPVLSLAKSTAIFSYASLLVVVFGFGVMGMADPQYDLSITTPWVMISLILYVVALVLNLSVVLPKLRQAAQQLQNGSVTIGGTSYTLIAISSGIVSLLLVAVVVLMVWKP
jgi:uncharacterized membrane protein